MRSVLDLIMYYINAFEPICATLETPSQYVVWVNVVVAQEDVF